MFNPCHRCQDRRPATRETLSCHADLPRYAAFAAEREKIRAARDKERISDGYSARSKAQHSAVVMQEAKRRRERTRR